MASRIPKYLNAGYVPRPSNVPLLRALWSLLDGIWGLLKGSWGVLVGVPYQGIVSMVVDRDRYLDPQGRLIDLLLWYRKGGANRWTQA